MAKLVVFGAGDIARLAHYYFTHDTDHQIVAFTVDRAYRNQDTFSGLPLVDFEDVAQMYPPSDHKMFVAVSYAKMNKLRAEKFYRAKALKAKLSRTGFAFNALSLYSDPDRRRPDLYYADPLYWFDHCKRRYCRFVALLHDYPLYEFTILVRKKEGSRG